VGVVDSFEFSVREEEALRPLDEVVGAGAEEFEEAEIAEDLELLADFVADVGYPLILRVNGIL
jgi:hypothetical protein